MTLREHNNLTTVLIDVLSSKNDLRRLLRFDNLKLKSYVQKGIISTSEKDAIRKKRELQIMQESKRVSGSPTKAVTRPYDRGSGGSMVSPPTTRRKTTTREGALLSL